MNRTERDRSSRLLWFLNNGPAIIAVLGSATLAIAAEFFGLTQLQLLQAILALLALIGTSLLTERLVEGRELRRRLDAIDAGVSSVADYAREIEGAGLDELILRRRDLPPLEDRLHGARRVSISGGSLFRLVNEYKSLFEQLAASGCQLRFLVTDPDAPAAEVLSSAVAYESLDVETYRAQLRNALGGLQHLAGGNTRSCEIRVCTLVPPFSLLVIEKGDASEVQVELYPFRLPARDRPLFVLHRHRDPRLYSLFTAQFDAIWNSTFARELLPA